jgi:hypothetical protein
MASSVTLLGPQFCDGLTYTSLLMRQLTGASRVADAGTASAVAPLGGVFTGLSTAMKVTPGTGLSVLVNAGYCAVPHPTQGHGVYLFGTMVQETLTIASNSSGNPRIDIVVAQVNDLGTSGSNCTVAVVTGTAASSPVAPPTPAASLLLAQVAVANGASSLSSGNITDERTWTAPPGGVIPVASAAASPAFPVTQLVYDQATSSLCQGTGTAGSLDSVSFLQAGTMTIVNTSTGSQGQTPGTPTSDPWGIGYGQIGSGGGKDGGGRPSTDGTAASEIKVTFTADGTSDYELAYQWGASVPAEAWVPASNVTAGQVSYLLYLDGTLVDTVVQFLSDSPLAAAGAGTASWYSSAALGTTPSAGSHTATLSVETSGTDESGASGVFVGDFSTSAHTIFGAPTGWCAALIAEQASVRCQAVQPG